MPSCVLCFLDAWSRWAWLSVGSSTSGVSSSVHSCTSGRKVMAMQLYLQLPNYVEKSWRAETWMWESMPNPDTSNMLRHEYVTQKTCNAQAQFSWKCKSMNAKCCWCCTVLHFSNNGTTSEAHDKVWLPCMLLYSPINWVALQPLCHHFLSFSIFSTSITSSPRPFSISFLWLDLDVDLEVDFGLLGGFTVTLSAALLEESFWLIFWSRSIELKNAYAAPIHAPGTCEFW